MGGRGYVKKRKGAVALELLFNFLIYLIVTVFLLQALLLPLQILLIDGTLRKAALVYVQIGHYENNHIPKNQLSFLSPYNGIAGFRSEWFNKNIEDATNKTKAEQLTEAYAKVSFPEDTFAGKIVNVKEMNITFSEKSIPILTKLFGTKTVTITCRYPLTLFNVVNFGIWLNGDYKGLYITRTVTFDINP